MNIAILCHGTVLLPAIQSIYSQGMLSAIGIPEILPAVNTTLENGAAALNIPLTTFYKKEFSFQITHWLQQVNPDVVCMMGFPYKIPEAVLRIPSYGFFNLHGGALPEYAGPDPCFWQIKNQEQKGAITVHQVTNKIDQGPIAHVEPLVFGPEDTYGMAMQRLGNILPRALIAFIQKLKRSGKNLDLTPQNKSDKAPYGKPDDRDQLIHWSWPAAKIGALVRACNPVFFGALTFLRGIPLRILNTSPTPLPALPEYPMGTIIETGGAKGLMVTCHKTQTLSVDTVCIEGGILTGTAFSKMMNIRKGESFAPPKT